jgi:hypothetical protein
MTLQLHDSPGLAARPWWKRAASTAARYYPNPYYQAARFAYRYRPNFLRDDSSGYAYVLKNIQGTPTYDQFLREEGLSGNENPVELSGRFGTWIKTKAVPGLQKLQKNLAPVIGLLPGGGTVNAAFDIINRPKDGSAPGPAVEPVMIPPSAPQMLPQLPAAPDYSQFAPMPYAGTMPAPSGLPFGLSWQTLALLGLGGVVLYKTLKK